MKSKAAILLLILFIARQVAAQETLEQTALRKKGEAKVWTGIALVGVGLFLLPVTEKNGGDSSWNAPASAGLVFTGGSLIWFGFRDQRKAMRPATTFGAVIGRTKGFQIRHLW